MCGINGIYNLDGSPVVKNELIKMNSMMRHRGPDDEGCFVSENVGLSMRRLSIIDIEGGHQPLANENDRYWIVFNGEIYNYIELRQGLEEKHCFKTKSDTEVILHLYEEYKDKCLQYLNGMFAFAIWDKEEKELFVARDRFGIKPLFYFYHEGRFAFSSELKSLLKVLPFQTEVDYPAFLLYLFLMYVPAPDCMIKGIKKLEPAHFMKIGRTGSYTKERYWDIEKFSTRDVEDEGVLKEELLFLLKDSLRMQKRSDVPIGTFLSGGLDSGTLVALLSEQTNMPLRTYSVGFEGHIYDERSAARLIAGRYGTVHKELLINSQMARESLPEVAYFMDEPVYDSAAVPTLLLSRMARQDGVKVILNGTGGDEVFGGYPQYRNEGFNRVLMEIFPKSLRKFAGKMLELAGSTAGIRLNNPVLDYLCRISGRVGFADKFLKDKEWDKVICSKLEETLCPIFFDPRLSSDVSRRMYFDLRTYLVGDLLMLLDKMTMGASVEGRVPLLDHRIAELMFSLTDRYKVSENGLKTLFRKTIVNMLPEELLNLPKRGFGAPVVKWVIENTFSSDNPWYKMWEEDDFLKEHIDIEGAKAFLRAASAKHMDSIPFFGLTFFAEWKRFIL